MAFTTQTHGDSIHSFLAAKDEGGAEIIRLDDVTSLVRPTATLEAWADAWREDPDVLALVRLGCSAPFPFLIGDTYQFLIFHKDCVPSSTVVKCVTRLTYRFPVKFALAPRMDGIDSDSVLGQSNEEMPLPKRKLSKRRKALSELSLNRPTTTFLKRSHCSTISIEAHNDCQAPVDFKLHWEVHPLGFPDDFRNPPADAGLFACRLGIMLRAKVVSCSSSRRKAMVSALHVKHTATVIGPMPPVHLHAHVWGPETAYHLVLVDTENSRRYGPDALNVRQSYAVSEGSDSSSSIIVTENSGFGKSHSLGLTVLPNSSLASAFKGDQSLMCDAVIGINNLVGNTLPKAYSIVTLQVDIMINRDGEPVSSYVFLQTLTLTNLFGNGQFSDDMERTYVVRSQPIAPETSKRDATPSSTSTTSAASATSIFLSELKRQSQQLVQFTFDPVSNKVRPAKMTKTGRIYAWARMEHELRSRARVLIKLDSLHRPMLSLDSGEISDAMRVHHHLDTHIS